MDGRHIKAKSDVQLASYPDTCFLFRMPEARDGGRHLPLPADTLETQWFRLLEALELRLAGRGEAHRNGTPIRFLPPPDEQNNGMTTLFPLHSLRVSLVTALALEGQVPFPVLQKLVGHSRLLMEYTLALVTLICMMNQKLMQRKLVWWNATHTSHS